MENENSKLEFSKRLKQALENTGFAELSLSSIATKFNLRHPNRPITPQTVHNWLIGSSIPTDDKIDTLSKLLNTSPEWLRYGISQIDHSQLSDDETQLLHSFRNISHSKQKLLLALLKELSS